MLLLFICYKFNFLCDLYCLDAPEQTTSPAKPNVYPSIQIPSTTATTTPPTPTLPACNSPSMLCPQSSLHICISPNQFCNGRKDCPDGFDEKYCVKRCPSESKLQNRHFFSFNPNVKQIIIKSFHYSGVSEVSYLRTR